jgi:glycine/D-amino acid oxidase-like deaminating enzyme
MAVELDVLVVGGGAQGLWLLNDLTKHHYRAVLLEKHQLGCGQTCHSHALIHRGHYYDDIDMMIVLNAAAQFWEALVGRKGLSKLNPNSALAGFGPGTAVERHTYFWRTAGLNFQECAQSPDVLAGGKVTHVFETEEFSLDAEQVVSCLAADVDNSIYKLASSGSQLRFQAEGRSITSVEADLEGESVELRPRFVVLAAGVGNFGLLRQLDAATTTSPVRAPVQAQRKNHMLVIRGRGLPPLTAVFPIRGGLQGVFICSRPDPVHGDYLWLVADHNSTPSKSSSEDDSATDASVSQEWIARILVSLKATAPGVLGSDLRGRLELCAYTGLTSERNFGVGQHMTDCYVDPLGFDNLLTIWPTKLTLTPFASNVAMRFIRPKVPDPSGEWPTIDRPITAAGPEVARETWNQPPFQNGTGAKTEWLPYDEFLEQWHLPQALA